MAALRGSPHDRSNISTDLRALPPIKALDEHSHNAKERIAPHFWFLTEGELWVTLHAVARVLPAVSPTIPVSVLPSVLGIVRPDIQRHHAYR